MRSERASSAQAAAVTVAAALGLPVDDVVVLQSSNRLALRLLPCDVFAHVAPLGREVAAREVELARCLADSASPVALLEPRVEPLVYEQGGFAVTFWTHYETTAPDHVTDRAYGDALHRLHAGMRSLVIAVPHFTDRAAEALRVVADPDQSPALTGVDRELLRHTLRDACAQILARSHGEQLLHGEPHPGNVLATAGGPLFIDLETSCRGPVELDVAHVPEAVSGYYPDVDEVLLGQCRRLALALVAAWRWKVDDDFRDGQRHGREIVAMLRSGPPWPVLGTLGAPPGGLDADS